MLPSFCRNAPCPPASWVDSDSVHPWNYVRDGHAAVPGADGLHCQREQHSCGPAGRGESGRPGQCDGFGSGRTWDKNSSLMTHCVSVLINLSSHLFSLYLSTWLSLQLPVSKCPLNVFWKSQHGFWLYVLYMGASVSCSQLASGKASWPRNGVWLGAFLCFVISLPYFFLHELL